MTDKLIQIKGLERTFQEGGKQRQVLAGIELDIARGETLALLGRSGSGKSTLLNLISGIDRPNAGSIHIDGHNLTNLPEPDLTLFRRQHIGFIYQVFHLIPTLTASENITLPLQLNHWSAAQSEARVKTLLAQIELTEQASQFPDQLSGGEQQRVAIARALAHKPLIVLADEPTGNLDAITGARVMQLLQQLVSQEGSTLVLVTHSRSVASSADRTLTLAQGQLTECEDDLTW